MSDDEEEIQFTLGKEIDDFDFVRGYMTAESQQNPFDDTDENDNMNNEEIENDEAPAMPQEFYSQFEDFIKHPAPKFNEPNNTKKKGKKGTKQPTSEPMFPKLVPDNQKSAPPVPPGDINRRIKAKAKITKGNIKPNNGKKLNENLLNEAFAYADKLLKDAIIEEKNEEMSRSSTVPNNLRNDNNSMKSTSKPRESNSAPNDMNKNKMKKSSSNTIGMVRKLKSQNQGKTGNTNKSNKLAMKEENFNLTQDKEKLMNKNAVDFDALVQNFQEGVTAQLLRKELEDSKKSMAKSEKFLRDLIGNM